MNKVFSMAMITAAAFVATAAPAQHSPYSGQQARSIKALPGEEVKQFLAGGGMGYARAAELNRYPGPMHVLELADKLALTPEQRAATHELMNMHKANARAIGAKVVAAEQELDRLFASSRANEATLAQQVKNIAALQGDYRLSHLLTHLHMRALLNEKQIDRYVQLRGYTTTADTESGNTGHSGKHH